MFRRVFAVCLVPILTLQSIPIAVWAGNTFNPGEGGGIQSLITVAEFHQIVSNQLAEINNLSLTDGLDHLSAIARLSTPQKSSEINPQLFSAETLLMLMTSLSISRKPEQIPLYLGERFAQRLGKENLPEIESIIQKLAGSADIEVTRRLAKLQKQLSLGRNGLGDDLNLIETSLDWFFESSIKDFDLAATVEPVEASELEIHIRHPVVALHKADRPNRPSQHIHQLPVERPPILPTILPTSAPESKFDDPLHNAMPALRAASAGDYKVNIFAKNINGEDRFVVLVGETHYKKEADAKLGKDLIKHFDYRATERFDPSLTWGGWLMKNLVFSFGKVAVWILMPQRLAGSSIIEIWSQIEASDLKSPKIMKLIESMSTEERQELEQVISTYSRTELQSELNRAGIRNVSADRMIEMMLDVLKPASERTAQSHQEKVRKFNLEEGHKPDLAEQLSSVVLPILFPTRLLALPTFLVSLILSLWLPNHATLEAMRNYSGYFFLAYFSYAILAKVFNKYFGNSGWVRAIFPLYDGNLVVRNKTMTTNINRIIERESAMRKMLAMVGMAHVPGIQKALVEEYGFREIPLSK